MTTLQYIAGLVQGAALLYMIVYCLHEVIIVFKKMYIDKVDFVYPGKELGPVSDAIFQLEARIIAHKTYNHIYIIIQ